MNPENHNEIWQVEVGGQIYEAALADLPEWIGEGSLQPDDKVRKGHLRWIEARRVPSLIPFFNAREKGEPMPVVKTVTEPEPVVVTDVKVPAVHLAYNAVAASSIQTELTGKLKNRFTSPDECANHSGVATAWICSGCNASLCKSCPKSYGGNVRICSECGSMCRSVKEVAENTRKESIAARSSTEAFGMSDLAASFAHPFKFKSSLFFGGLMYMFFTVGQSASGIGGIFMTGASIICVMLANMLTFGVLANTAMNFTQGNLEADFMPGFEDFSIWDDVVHPFFLSIGAYIASFGPFLIVAAIGTYLIFSNLAAQSEKFNQQLSKIPGTELYAPDRTIEQSQKVKDLLAKVKEHNEDALVYKEGQVAAAESADQVENESTPDKGQALAEEAAELERSFNQTRAEQLEAIAGSASKPEDQYREMFNGILRIAAPLVVVGILALLWGLFYFPAACVVAGYSRSFLATINPTVGLDTIRRLGATYVKILLMALLLAVISITGQVIVSTLLSPFDLPRLGNIPATAIGSFIAFYFWVVFFCVLGFALFKSADRLKLYK